MIGYKLVGNRFGQLVSWQYFCLPKELVITYIPGQKAYPTIGKLFVFADKTAAFATSSLRNWNTKQLRAEELWECEYGESDMPVPHTMLSTMAEGKLFRLFWEGKIVPGSVEQYLLIQPTQDTRLADWVILTERVV